MEPRRVAAGQDTSGQRRGDIEEQGDRTVTAKRLLRQFEALLIATRVHVEDVLVQRSFNGYEEPSASEDEPLLGSNRVPVGQGDAYEAVQCLLLELEELLNEALESVQESYRSLFEVPTDSWNRKEACEAVELLLMGLSKHSMEAEEAVGKYCPTLWQIGEPAGQRGGAAEQVGPSETVQLLVTGVTGLLKSAEQCLQTQRPAAWGDTSEASRLLYTQLAQLVRSAEGSVLTFNSATKDQRHLPGGPRRLLLDLAEHFRKSAASVKSYRVNIPENTPVTHRLPLLAGTSYLNHYLKDVCKCPMLAAVSVLVMAVLLVAIGVLYMASAAKNGKDVKLLPPCGDDWIWYRNKCYYFFEAEGTWAEAKDSCAALNSSLAMIDTQKELNFMLRHKGDHNHWIGLRRDDKTQLWTWVNGTNFNNWFTVSDASECAYLGYGKVKSLECDITNKWICTRGTIYG